MRCHVIVTALAAAALGASAAPDRAPGSAAAPGEPAGPNRVAPVPGGRGVPAEPGSDGSWRAPSAWRDATRPFYLAPYYPRSRASHYY
jgi:hypothetical protein